MIIDIYCYLQNISWIFEGAKVIFIFFIYICLA